MFDLQALHLGVDPSETEEESQEEEEEADEENTEEATDTAASMEVLACPMCKQHEMRSAWHVVYLAGECPACFEHIEKMMTAPCGHILCHSCLGNLKGVKTNTTVAETGMIKKPGAGLVLK